MLGAVGGRGCQLSERGQKGLGRSTPPHPRLPGADGSGEYWGGGLGTAPGGQWCKSRLHQGSGGQRLS